ncbi:MAG: hypothetical protein C4297_00155 [Gemmataceae bacterium]
MRPPNLFQRVRWTVIVGYLLCAAAVLKGYEIANEELAGTSLFTSRWFLMAIVLYELILGLWAISGFYVREVRWLLLLTFIGLFQASLYTALAGYPSCGCLGRVHISPWWTTLLDGGIIFALILWSPARGSLCIVDRTHLFAFHGVTAFVVVLLAGTAMLLYSPTGVMPSLRSDPQLAQRISISIEKASPAKVLEEMRRLAGVQLLVAPELEKSWLERTTNIRMVAVPIWSLMEWLVQANEKPCRWVKKEDGYELVPAAPLGRYSPWVTIAALIFGTGAVSLFKAKATA